MIYISGIEDGSGDGTAAGRKAGWLPRSRISPSELPPMRTAPSIPARYQGSFAAPPETRVRPAVGPDGRPLPPDGSAPPARPSAGAPDLVPAPLAPEPQPISAQRPSFDPDGRPLPPDGAVPRTRPAVPAGVTSG